MKKAIFLTALLSMLLISNLICAETNQVDAANSQPPLPAGNTNANASNWLATFSSGAEFTDPYVISVPSGAQYGTLTNAGNNTVGYLQFDLTRRWVFDPSSAFRSTNLVANRLPIYGAFADHNLDDLTPDFQYDIGFLFGNSVNSTNKTYTAQTLAGSDIFAQISAGLPLWRNDYYNDNGIAVQLALFGSVGMTTEQSFEIVHANEFIGGALDVGLNYNLFGIGNTNAPGLAEFRVGEANLDFPSLTGTANQVNLDGNGIPKFNARWVPEMDANVLIPFGDYVYLNVAANAWLNGQPPNQWNIKVGVTLPWATVKSMFPFIK